ncbi:MAG: response regulator [Bacteroidales bacterium]|nr:response regulator [Bacteroidales bacterium]
MKQKYTILYVDDEPINLHLFNLHLKKQYNIFTALSGKVGLEILKNNIEINVVVSDMKMPEMNGIEFIKIAKSNFPNLYYFILTGFEVTDEIKTAIEENLIVKYFRKPFNINDIKNTINKSLENLED